MKKTLPSCTACHSEVPRGQGFGLRKSEFITCPAYWPHQVLLCRSCYLDSIRFRQPATKVTP